MSIWVSEERVDIREYRLNSVPLLMAAALRCVLQWLAPASGVPYRGQPHALVCSQFIVYYICILYLFALCMSSEQERCRTELFLRRRENYYHCIIVFSPTTSTSCYNIVNYINKSVGEDCLNTYQKLVVEADNGPLLLLPELWIRASWTMWLTSDVVRDDEVKYDVATLQLVGRWCEVVRWSSVRLPGDREMVAIKQG
jgi:hypothetical protein